MTGLQSAPLFIDCQTTGNVGVWQILLQKSFWGDARKNPEPLMRFDAFYARRRDEGRFHPKSITDLRGGAEKRRSSKEAQRSTFARFLRLFDFRLFQQNRHLAGISLLANDRFAPILLKKSKIERL